jgi:AraC-like DNA-binding protein
MDFIGAALQKMRVTAARVGRSEVCAPWQIEAGGEGLPVAYYFLRGRGEIELAGQEGRRIEAGDLVLVPRGERHRVRDGMQDGVRADCVFLHATMQAEIGADCPFIAALPPLLIVRAGDRAGSPYLDSHLQSLVWEASTSGPASDLLLARLWEVVFLLAFRTYLVAADQHTTGWLAAIRDPQMARVLGAIQQRPHEDWTVERLAAEAAMSRATFIRQFIRVMGEPPMRFLYQHRMGVAASLLQQGAGGLAAVAAQVGYGSEAAFSSAFRRHFGFAPGAYRAGQHLDSAPKNPASQQTARV